MNRLSLLLAMLLLGGALAGCADNDQGTPTPTPTATTTATPSPTPTTTTSVVPTVTPTLPTPAGNLTNSSSGLFVRSIPTNLTAGQNATICWTVNGTGRIPHTALHFDNESHPNSTSFQDYDKGAIYPGNATSADPAGYAVPGEFCANLMVPETGSLYFRAHVLVPGVRNELSTEHELDGGTGTGSGST